MGLFQNAIKTYDENSDKIGIYEADKEPFAPVGHIVTNASIIISIDKNGKYISSQLCKNKYKVIIPVTEQSAGRSGTAIFPHPLCEQLKYLAGYSEKSKKYNDAYLKQLGGWINSSFSDPKLSAVYSYISDGTIIEDLKISGSIKVDSNGVPNNDEQLIVWNVIGYDDCSEVWKDLHLMSLYTNYCIENSKENKSEFCNICGEFLPLANSHLKGVFYNSGNAKLISSNDKYGFTYRGRFTSADEALTISYLSSQKAHNALKWLVSNNATVVGNKAFLCWNPDVENLPSALFPLVNLFPFEENLNSPQYDYKDQLYKTVMGLKTSLTTHLSESHSIVAAFEAATNGRLSVTMYSEMPTNDFLISLRKWDETFIWYSFGNIRTFSLSNIADYAFGTERDSSGNGKVETDKKIKGNTVERLIQCRIGESLFPLDIERRLVQNASSPLKYGKNTKKAVLNVACAAIRKYYLDHFNEDVGMSLNKDKNDLSYQYGRLLAVYEKMERDTYNNDDDDNSKKSKSRIPNAIKLQSAYCSKPMYYASILEKKIDLGYFRKLSPASQFFYKGLLGEIMEKIGSFDECEWNKPLKDTYLIGYYLQRNELYKKKEKATEDTTEETC